MDVMLAAYHLVRDYPGGAVALGPLVGKNPATLSHEVKPRHPLAKLGLQTAVDLSVWAHDRRIASAFAAQVGCMLLLLPEGPRAGKSVDDIAVMAREFGDLVSRIAEASADGAVSANEAAAVEVEAGQLIAAIQAAVQHVATQAKQSQSRAALSRNAA